MKTVLPGANRSFFSHPRRRNQVRFSSDAPPVLLRCSFGALGLKDRRTVEVN